MSLQELLAEQQQRRLAAKEELGKKKEAVEASVAAVSEALLERVRGEVAVVYRQQQALESDAKTLQAESARFVRQAAEWKRLYTGFHDALADLGDVAAWAAKVESELERIGDSLSYAAAAEAGSGGGGAGASE